MEDRRCATATRARPVPRSCSPSCSASRGPPPRAPPPPAPPPPPGPPPAPRGGGGAAPPGPPAPPPPAPRPSLTNQELDALVAPIALYPDIVLDSLLPATTDPLGVVAAARHLQASPGATSAPAGTTWDGSVVAMLQFPDVLRWMSDNLPWLESMGYAVASQQADVLAAVQRVRERAVRSGALSSDEHLRVAVEAPPPEAQAPAGTTYVVIAPAQPEIVYVPAYDPWPLLSATWTWAPGRSFLTFRLAFTFGSQGSYGPYGPWAWHDIVWSWGTHHHVRVCGQAWWWWRARPPAWTWGPFRPVPWRPSWTSRPWASRAWRPDLTPRARPSAPTWHSYATTERRTVTVQPPAVRPGVTWRSPGIRTTVTPPPARWSAPPSATWPVPGTTTVPRTLPRWDWRSLERARPSGPTPTWHLPDGGRATRQIDRGTRSLFPQRQPTTPRRIAR